MAQYGLLGEKLPHSYSPQIHSMLGEYGYQLFEVATDQLENFLRSEAWDGINVTIPYKKAIFRYLGSVSAEAENAGCVNTVVKKDGQIYGDNTGIYGFTSMVLHSSISVVDTKALVLGSGGASAAVCIALKSLGCTPIIISRGGPDNYSNLNRHQDAAIIVNTTPVGMYPNTGTSPVNLEDFPDCRGVFDVIYNPFRTKLLMQAEKLGIPCENGLYMLVAQAKRSSELFTGQNIPDSEIKRIYDKLAVDMGNVVLIGMPGCGKTTVAHELGRITGRKVLDTDSMITDWFDLTPQQFILQKGEPAFRKAEHEVVAEAGKVSGAIIATGGGAVTIADNYEPLHQNGTIIWLQRSLDELSIQSRPLSVGKTPQVLYAEREPLYRAFADYTLDMDCSDAIGQLLRILGS